MNDNLSIDSNLLCNVNFLIFCQGEDANQQLPYDHFALLAKFEFGIEYLINVIVHANRCRSLMAYASFLPKTFRKKERL